MLADRFRLFFGQRLALAVDLQRQLQISALVARERHRVMAGVARRAVRRALALAPPTAGRPGSGSRPCRRRRTCGSLRAYGSRRSARGAAACRRRRSTARSVGGQLMRRCTSAAPAARTILTILRLVVPRTIESSIRTTRLPSRMLLHRIQLHLHAEMADRLRRLDERAADVVIADQARSASASSASSE